MRYIARKHEEYTTKQLQRIALTGTTADFRGQPRTKTGSVFEALQAGCKKIRRVLLEK